MTPWHPEDPEADPTVYVYLGCGLFVRETVYLRARRVWRWLLGIPPVTQADLDRLEASIRRAEAELRRRAAESDVDPTNKSSRPTSERGRTTRA